MSDDLDSSRIFRIDELTRKLNGDPTKIVYKVDGGEVTTKGLMKKAEVGVMDVLIPAGATFPMHVHDEKEIVAVYLGRLRIQTMNGKDIWVEVGDTYIMPAGVQHNAIAEIETRLIAITIPADKGYADG